MVLIHLKMDRDLQRESEGRSAREGAGSPWCCQKESWPQLSGPLSSLCGRYSRRWRRGLYSLVSLVSLIPWSCMWGCFDQKIGSRSDKKKTSWESILLVPFALQCYFYFVQLLFENFWTQRLAKWPGIFPPKMTMVAAALKRQGTGETNGTVSCLSVRWRDLRICVFDHHHDGYCFSHERPGKNRGLSAANSRVWMEQTRTHGTTSQSSLRGNQH